MANEERSDKESAVPVTSIWYHRTKQRSADSLYNGSRPKVPFWGSSLPDGCPHRRGDAVVAFSISGKELSNISYEEAEFNGLMRPGERWIVVRKDPTRIVIHKKVVPEKSAGDPADLGHPTS